MVGEEPFLWVDFFKIYLFIYIFIIYLLIIP